ncbi:hypothetical protein [Roseateles depolymerans]|uniref:Uncharacterized protein n=1 Tax=Roseateles depolymerans TaxID=76731 RepID=A0A0U3DVH1_9BURK|nr:hypothetical protein [Roseateles depolymerans]ALV04741.1 hypothetical protein RD2015_237 [Roseateles depolymerans]REG15248.1 hypothetical protein DES44_3755 [Roseateles depolymerans]
MTSFNRQSACVLAAVAALLTACGGGSADSSPDTKGLSARAADAQTPASSPADTPTPTPTLSANQAAFEEFLLSPGSGSYLLHWTLSYTGLQSSLVTAYSDFTTLPLSPLTNGPQTSAQSEPFNISKTLRNPTLLPTRVLKGGKILVVPSNGLMNRTSYVGNDVQIDALAEDKTTVAYSAIRSNYETVSLTGTMATTPADFARFHDPLFGNSKVLDATAPYAAGAKYIKFTKTNLGDRYNAGDCQAATTTANVSPCRIGTTLLATMTSGQRSNSDGVTYYLADGTVRTVDGVQIWVANAPRPKSATLSYTEEFRIYFELGGNVYTGSLIKDGTVLGGSYYVSNPSATTLVDRLTFLPYDIRLNKAAHDSIVSAMKI